MAREMYPVTSPDLVVSQVSPDSDDVLLTLTRIADPYAFVTGIACTPLCFGDIVGQHR